MSGEFPMSWKAVPLVSPSGPSPARCPAHAGQDDAERAEAGEGPAPGGHLEELRREPLGLLRRSAKESAHRLARLDTGPGACLVVSDPDAVDVVLTDHDAAFFKPKMERWKQVLGENVLTSEGPAWARSRRRSMRITGARYVRRAARVVAEVTDERLRSWAGTGAVGVDGAADSPRSPCIPGSHDIPDIHEEMRTLTLAAVLRHLCGTDDDFDLRAFGRHLRTVMECIHALESAPAGAEPSARVERAFAHAAGELRAAVLRLVASHAGGDDLVGLLTAPPDTASDDGRAAEPLTPDQVCDEVLAHLIAGHESTATALAWSLLLLSRDADVTRRVRTEIGTTVGGRAPGPADLAGMPLLQAVFTEALRLCPPAWTIMRATGRPCELSGVRLPAGAVLLASPYSIQRSGRWFPRPDEFLPDRWLGDAAAGAPRYAYFPFGGGRRSCPGRMLAQVTAGVVLTRVLQGFRIEPVGEPPTADVGIILRPSPGTRLRAVPLRRESAGQREESP
ncbi:cytochrome P450 [Streptomyces aurantiacus]|uniref:Putative Epi-isozizaene 5-monooxygenase/(E)-beta-farnesene synthase n=1 Tax=Streptomyces aurantiacus JA 4570 TaxID=1286094 RepID=S4AS11_9ACTN|nr:cytochrome P450 [Streptomyces aurantiacus]EPH44217.1 putative Epi-isozizaene 5-monooxygenase/(E)-beta-farnesene synthase [Streptomyces aurantiacus JA 4570]